MPNKIHISGLDNLDAQGLEEYLGAYVQGRKWRHIEWIDDSSANVVWDRSVSVGEILALFSSIPNPAIATTEARFAKAHPSRAEAQLFVRQALVGDKKIKGARDRSRFYLMHPEHDPETRRRDTRGDSHRSTRREPVPKSFTADMYDDEAESSGSEAKPVARPSRENDSRSSSQRQRGKELFDRRDDANRLNGRRRSPNRDGDGRFGFSDVQPARRTARARSRSRSPTMTTRPDRDMPSNAGKELFPSGGSAGRELFTDHSQVKKSSGSRKDLFPDYDVARKKSRLEDSTSGGILSRRTFDNDDEDEVIDSGISIKGNASTWEEDISIKGRGGISIKGSAARDDISILDAARKNKVKELFPDYDRKTRENSGKELFPAANGGGRAPRRRRAEDLL